MFDLAKATGEETYRRMALRLLNSGTYWIDHTGLLRTYIWPFEEEYTQRHEDGSPVRPTVTVCQWFHIQIMTSSGYLRAMADDPSLAPDGENHLLHTTCPISSIAYAADKVEYTTLRKSSDLL